jgi:hypothetical protein
VNTIRETFNIVPMCLVSWPTSFLGFDSIKGRCFTNTTGRQVTSFERIE